MICSRINEIFLLQCIHVWDIQRINKNTVKKECTVPVTGFIVVFYPHKFPHVEVLIICSFEQYSGVLYRFEIYSYID